MRKTDKPVKPSELEYSILKVLWQMNSGTVRDVHQQLSAHREIVYTSVLKTLQIMTEKGMVKRDEAERAHVYTPTFSEEATQGTLLTDLVQRVFGGSAQHLVLRALQLQPASKEELSEIRRLIDAMENQPENESEPKAQKDK